MDHADDVCAVIHGDGGFEFEDFLDAFVVVLSVLSSPSVNVYAAVCEGCCDVVLGGEWV